MSLVKYTKKGEPYCEPGALRVPITFLQPVSVVDASGVSSTWAPASPPDITFAGFEAVKAADVIKGGQDTSKVWGVWTIRYRNPPRQATDRLQEPDGDIYIIRAVENIIPGKKKFQVLTCELIGTNV